MDKIRGALDVELTIEEVTYLNALIERDKEKAVVRKDWEIDDSTYTDYKCPVCNTNTRSGDNFCSKCGQRIDRDNIAL